MVQSTDSLPARVAERPPASRPKAPAKPAAPPVGTRPFRPFRVADRRALSPRPPARGLHLGHRRLLLHRHHARRRDADHRHGGDERLPRPAHRQDPRPERPPDRPADRLAAHRLRRRFRPDRRASTASSPWCRWSRGRRSPAAATPRAACIVRGVRDADLPQGARHRRQREARHAREFRGVRGRRHRHAPRRVARRSPSAAASRSCRRAATSRRSA